MGICGSKPDKAGDTKPGTSKARVRSDNRNSGGASNGKSTTAGQKDGQDMEGGQSGNSMSNEGDKKTTLEEELQNTRGLPVDEQSSSQSGSNNQKAIKVLLLGAGESGKSTILQQLKILHQNGFTKQELIDYTPLIYDNIIAKLWNMKSTQELIMSEKSSQFYMMDSTKYFLDNLDRICNTPNYIPTEQDVLRSRQKTSGIFDTVVNMDNNFQMHIYDVGGQRSERKKWIHCFDNVTLVIFCVSLSEYDQFLMEDKSQNRFQESLVLFDNIVNSRWFARTSVVLFLNKIDLFAEKIQRVPLEHYFPDYMGGKDINKAAKYILWRFVQLNRANLNIYPHVTQATDTSNIKLVFAAIKETILENLLKDSGVLQ